MPQRKPRKSRSKPQPVPEPEPMPDNIEQASSMEDIFEDSPDQEPTPADLMNLPDDSIFEDEPNMDNIFEDDEDPENFREGDI